MDTAEAKQEWIGLVESFEAQLCLISQEPGSLAKFSNYLYYRTGGSIGALNTLIRQGANLAIQEDKETLLKKFLEKVKLDEGSEKLYEGFRPKKLRKQKEDK